MRLLALEKRVWAAEEISGLGVSCQRRAGFFPPGRYELNRFATMRTYQGLAGENLLLLGGPAPSPRTTGLKQKGACIWKFPLGEMGSLSGAGKGYARSLQRGLGGKVRLMGALIEDPYTGPMGRMATNAVHTALIGVL